MPEELCIFVLMEEIVNRVENSGLIAVDLADFSPKNTELMSFDFAPALWHGLVLKEKDFRVFVKEYDWEQYRGKHAYLFCSAEAILPSWAFMLVTSQLVGIARTVTIGDERSAKQHAIEEAIRTLPVAFYENGKLIVKGCSDLPNPEAIMTQFLLKVQPVCASVMYGEPCSTVPIFKRPKVR